MTILDKMMEKCNEAGYVPTKNIEKIAKAKTMMFGEAEWHRCPCDSQNASRYCISEQCKKDIAEKGVCHCNCYQKAAEQKQEQTA